MKTPTATLTQRAAVVPPVAPQKSTSSRPVRRGGFWPGEKFTAYTNKWDLSGAFAGPAFILPALGGNNGSRTL